MKDNLDKDNLDTDRHICSYKKFEAFRNKVYYKKYFSKKELFDDLIVLAKEDKTAFEIFTGWFDIETKKISNNDVLSEFMFVIAQVYVAISANQRADRPDLI